MSEQEQQFEQFLLWEQTTRDTIDFKTIYVDMADDLIAGLMLSQIVFWHLPNAQGRSKLRVRKDGRYWIAKGRTDWYDEIRVTAKQVDRALGILERRGIIETALYKFDGAPTKHVRILSEGFLSAWRAALQERGKSISTKGENPTTPKVEMDIAETGKSITEITSETTTEGEAPAPAEKHEPEQESDPRRNDPAMAPVFAYIDESGARLPSESCLEEVRDTVGPEPDDVQFWRQVVHVWIAHGWRKGNLYGMLECFRERRLPGEGRGQNGGAGVTASTQQEPVTIYGLNREPEYL